MSPIWLEMLAGLRMHTYSLGVDGWLVAIEEVSLQEMYV